MHFGSAHLWKIVQDPELKSRQQIFPNYAKAADCTAGQASSGTQIQFNRSNTARNSRFRYILDAKAGSGIVPRLFRPGLAPGAALFLSGSC
jgi:hypothetical protein